MSGIPVRANQELRLRHYGQLPTQSRKLAGRGESDDDLGRVPDGYSTAIDSGAAKWSSGNISPTGE